MGGNTPFRDACRMLRASNPEAWEALLSDMRLYTAQAMDAVIDTPDTRDDLLVLKGWAQACKALTTTFSNLD